MIYTRKINDKTGITDYSGTSEELIFEILMTIRSMIEHEDLESRNLEVLAVYVFKNLKEIDKLIFIDRVISEVKGGNLWQELEGLSKSEKK